MVNCVLILIFLYEEEEGYFRSMVFAMRTPAGDCGLLGGKLGSDDFVREN